MPIEKSINLPILAVKMLEIGLFMFNQLCHPRRSASHQLLRELLLNFLGEACFLGALGHWLLIFAMTLTLALQVKL